ncbi:MAG: aldehyde ferredoxin oxidoreductase N-terminal domain-containing protein, partial [Thermodesulfobacteriota bacterium]
MKAQSFGWSGKILKVDLSDGKIAHLDTMAYADRFLGGRGIATRLYWEGVSPDTGALEPGNRLIFMTGPLVATGVQGASRFEVVGKSPMTLPEGFCYGNLGGFFGPALKRAGYDGIVVEGRAGSPCYIWIKDGKAELRDGRDLWKKGTKETMAILRETHGSGTRVVTTGPAGENLCRSATLVTDHQGSATGGFGAVMGS